MDRKRNFSVFNFFLIFFIFFRSRLATRKHLLVVAVRERIGPFASPDIIQNAPALPKTRSGKIMRRVLRKVALGISELGDISTMADTSVVDVLFRNRPDDDLKPTEKERT